MYTKDVGISEIGQGSDYRGLGKGCHWQQDRFSILVPMQFWVSGGIGKQGL